MRIQMMDEWSKSRPLRAELLMGEMLLLEHVLLNRRELRTGQVGKICLRLFEEVANEGLVLPSGLFS